MTGDEIFQSGTVISGRLHIHAAIHAPDLSRNVGGRIGREEVHDPGTSSVFVPMDTSLSRVGYQIGVHFFQPTSHPPLEFVTDSRRHIVVAR